MVGHRAALCVQWKRSLRMVKQRADEVIMIPSFRQNVAFCCIRARHTYHPPRFCNHRRRSSVDFRGHDIFCPKNMCEKLSKYPNFYDICPKNARILHNNCPKNICPFFLGGGTRAPIPSPVSTLMFVLRHSAVLCSQ